MCWGSNSFGRLGDGTRSDRSHPTPVDAPKGVVFAQLSASHNHTCGLDLSGAAWCWGDNTWGQVGDGTTTGRLSPSLVSAPERVAFTTLAAGDRHTCGLQASGQAWCWGDNSRGQVGDGTQTDRQVPIAVDAPDGVGFVRLAAGGSYTCGLTDTGRIFCWGANGDGQLGDGTNLDHSRPAPLSTSGVRFRDVAAGRLHTCAVSRAGAAWCWGANLNGQVGDGTTTSRLVPTTAVPVAGVDFARITVGEAHTCTTSVTGRAYCWGLNSNGQLGDGTTTDRHTPTLAAERSETTFTSLQAKGVRTCGLSDTSRTYCW